MEINGTEVGLGIGAVITSILSFFGIKLKRDRNTQIASIYKRIGTLEASVARLEEKQMSLHNLQISEKQALSEVLKEMKEHSERIQASVAAVRESTARIEGLYEASSKRNTQ